ncbi:uncharacterized protein K02A2.6-like [Juglans microcarpa x Juglans regia]|uniref:uncharacterized protein K02A2.6-like n=1 Tax=Juglans microcarpa x Juglans regia TaxID=2249226 RepID=UPI001B7F2E24|nr:uncharacterized protein K02A2.6-like [Juglans microcarpa x Juglans regia]
MDDEALVWFQNASEAGTFHSWEDFIKAVQIRFGSTPYDDPMESITQLKHYKAEFEILSNCINAKIQEQYVVSIRKPWRNSLIDLSKFSPKSSLLKSGQTPSILGTPRVPLLATLPYHKVSESQMVESCEMDADVSGEVAVELMEVEAEIASISFQPMVGVGGPKTMRLFAYIGKKKLVILIDTGITHNFVDTTVAAQCKLHVQLGQTICVKVANGQLIDSTGKCRVVHLFIQGIPFIVDFFTLPLGGCDPILGIQCKGFFMQLVACDSIESSTLQDEQVQQLLQQYKDVFDEPTGLPPNRSHDHKINLKQGTSRITVKPYRHPFFQKTEIENIFKELLNSGVIRPSQSPFSSLILLVRKSDSTWRMCIDYRALNEVIIKDKYLIPVVDELLDELSSSTIFSKLDLRASYHQIRMRDEDVHKTAFRTHEGHYEFLVMPFGLTNAPSTFQGLMNEHHQLYAKQSKCRFACQEIEYLGHLISKEGVRADPRKLESMVTWPIPKNLKSLRAFLGLIDSATKPFNDLKVVVTCPLVLALPDFTKAFVTECDACATGVGAVLMQDQRPLAFLSQALKGKNLALSTYEKEFLALVLAVKKWRSYLLGSAFVGVENKVADALSRKDQVDELRELAALSYPTLAWLSELKILNYLHSIPVAGHSDFHKCLHRARLEFYWPGLKHDVKHIRECETCQRNKIQNVILAGFLQPLPIPEQIWTDLSMDFVEGLPILRGYSVILVVVDRLSKYAHFMPLKHPFTAAQVASLFFNNVFKLHGLPKTIVSDYGSIFTSSFWKELFRLQGVNLSYSSAYHPQSDGQTEAVNKCLEHFLRSFSGDKPKLWVDWLSLAEWWYNPTFHTSTKLTPFEVVYRVPPTRLQAYIPGLTNQIVDQLLQTREQILLTLKSNLSLAQDRMKFYYDKHRTNKEFSMGDWRTLQRLIGLKSETNKGEFFLGIKAMKVLLMA